MPHTRNFPAAIAPVPRTSVHRRSLAGGQQFIPASHAIAGPQGRREAWPFTIGLALTRTPDLTPLASEGGTS
jgi:hypothetical protein